jgi:hypothetical protein
MNVTILKLLSVGVAKLLLVWVGCSEQPKVMPPAVATAVKDTQTV